MAKTTRKKTSAASRKKVSKKGGRKQGAAKVDRVTLDVIENALKGARFEMDATIYRTSMSPSIREQHDEFPIIADPEGRMLVGQFGSWLGDLNESFPDAIEEDDVIFTNDPYLCGGTISTDATVSPTDNLRPHADRAPRGTEATGASAPSLVSTTMWIDECFGWSAATASRVLCT